MASQRRQNVIAFPPSSPKTKLSKLDSLPLNMLRANYSPSRLAIKTQQLAVSRPHIAAAVERLVDRYLEEVS